MTWAVWIISIAGPFIIKALTAVGISVLTFTGVTSALQALIDQATNNWAGISSDILALSSIAGIPQSIGIICGAMTSRVGMWAAVSATRWITAA